MPLRPIWLNRIIAADAASCAGLGVLCLAAPDTLSRLLGLSHGLLGAAGFVLIVSAAVLAFAATRRPVPGALLRLIVLGNIGWVVASLAALVVVPMTTLGLIVVAGQAFAVAVIAAAEGRFIRSSATDTATAGGAA